MNFLHDTIHALSPKTKQVEPKKEETPPPADVTSTPTDTPIDTFTTTAFLEANNRKPRNTKMNISIPADLKARFTAKCSQEGRTKSMVIQYWIKQYLSGGDTNEN